ncbi:patatin-like phospholipase family protein [Thermovibrio sp.]
MKVSATLSGGFVKGVVHIGFLKALEYKGLPPSFVCGASAGALIGGLYCAGYSPDEITEIAKKYSWYKLASPSFRGALFKLDGLYRALKELLGDAKIEEFKIPFGLTVVNLQTLKCEFKRSGPAAELITASCSIPPLFSPWKVGSEFYIDGGVRNSLPSEMGKASGGELNVCSRVLFKRESGSTDSIKDITLQTVCASLMENQERRLSYCDIIVSHEFKGGFLTFKDIEETVKFGFNNTLRELEGRGYG